MLNKILLKHSNTHNLILIMFSKLLIKFKIIHIIRKMSWYIKTNKDR